MERIRTVKNKNYTTISNVFLRDKNLSLKAKGLLALIMSLPDSWDFSVEGIKSLLPEGRDALYSTLKELITTGYCTRQDLREKGQMRGLEYTFYEQPYTGLPDTGNTDTANTTQLSKEETKKKELKERSTEQQERNFPLSPYPPHFASYKFNPRRDLDQLKLEVCTHLELLYAKLYPTTEYAMSFIVDIEDAILWLYQKGVKKRDVGVFLYTWVQRSKLQGRHTPIVHDDPKGLFLSCSIRIIETLINVYVNNVEDDE